MATKKAKAPAKKTSKKATTTKASASAAAAAAANVVLAWEDDPASMPNPAPIQRPVPNLANSRLAIRIQGNTPPPRIYQRGTREFRFWVAAESLRRGADFWAGIVPANFRWMVGATLPVRLDEGIDLNAFYSRGGGNLPPGLSFFHDTSHGVTCFSAESPEVACHELGHAVLDALRPQLFHVAFVEAAAFHESFGDMSAILSALQRPSLRTDVIASTGGRIGRNSRVSRVAEQLGLAIRLQRPDAVDRDSLRNASNSFFYRDPATLPPRAPANLLSSAPHSFSRVFTGAFLEILAGVFLLQGRPGNEKQLADAAKIAAQLLVGAVQAAPVVPSYYAQVAAHFLAVDASRFQRKFRDVIKGAFVRRGILSLDAAASGMAEAGAGSGAAAPALGITAAADAVDSTLQFMALSGRRFGIDTLLIPAPANAPRFSVASAATDVGEIPPVGRESAAKSFVEDLFRLGRVDMGAHGDPESRVSQPNVGKTHELVSDNGAVRLERRTFECGFDSGC
jgi:hypothetical protein